MERAASEQLAGSINEITRQVSDSSSTAAEAVSETREVNEQICGLSVASQKIGEIVNLIILPNRSGAQRWIEAARAGDAGKGFAAVATRLKAWRCQTEPSTETPQVNNIQGAVVVAQNPSTG